MRTDDAITDAEIVPQEMPKKRTLPANCRKKHGTLAKKTKKALSLVLDHGVEPREALILATGNPKPSQASVALFKGKVEKYALTSPRMQKLAHHVVEDVLKGKPREYEIEKMGKDGEVVTLTHREIPSHTNQLAAVALVADRVDPVVRQNLNMNINAEISPVDLSKYLNR